MLAAVVGATIVALAQQGDGVIRLKPREFRQLPTAVRRDLDRRGCTVPQTNRKTAAHNVISGAFVANGSRDWAVLCSVKGASRILVYRNGSNAHVDSLAFRSDASFMQANASGVMEFSRKIDIAEPKSISDRVKANGGPKPPTLDHDGIEDGLETASAIRYYSRGKWKELLRAD